MEVVLHPALGGEPVVVPPDRVEHLLAAHALEPRDRVGVGEGENVPDVQLPADGQRRGVDGEDVATRGGPVKRVLRRPLPTGATTSPRCRQARACPARGWPGARGARGPGGNRCSWRQGYLMAGPRCGCAWRPAGCLVAGPARAAEHLSQPLIQRLADLVHGTDRVDHGALRRGQPGRLLVVQPGADMADRDQLDLAGVDEAQAPLGGDDQAVEQILPGTSRTCSRVPISVPVRVSTGVPGTAAR